MSTQAVKRDPLGAAPSPDDFDTGVKHRQKVAAALSAVLADTYVLMIKTHAHHWNVVGPLFYSIHHLTEEQYQEMFGAVDVMAERVRALGALAPANIAEMLEHTELSESKGGMDAAAMVGDLVADHEKIARRHHRLAALAGEAEDIGTEDLAVARTRFHEKAAWMLRALLAE
jgi:starvation-inducible DNA-binding protein